MLVSLYLQGLQVYSFLLLTLSIPKIIFSSSSVLVPPCTSFLNPQTIESKVFNTFNLNLDTPEIQAKQKKLLKAPIMCNFLCNPLSMRVSEFQP